MDAPPPTDETAPKLAMLGAIEAGFAADMADPNPEVAPPTALLIPVAAPPAKLLAPEVTPPTALLTPEAAPLAKLVAPEVTPLTALLMPEVTAAIPF